MNLNTEKQNIIAQKGNVLVTANPGTGKTLLLAGKYLDLLRKGVEPAQILCLTFTEKAKTEMDERIIKAIQEEKIDFDFSKLNVFTFHSYALQNLDGEDIISSNLLRYAIYRYITDNDILDYSEDYLIDMIVPKLESLIRYLKSFGIMPDTIDLKAVKALIEDSEKYSKEELDAFAGHFVNVFRHYESIKAKKGYDYSDLLIEFLKLKKCPKYEHVLVDELQDVNSMEADIVLRSCENYFVVGDKKQAIFGFQGGSIINFSKFSESKSFVLSENYRSTNEILSYAREYFQTSQDDESKKELSKLSNPQSKEGKKPAIYEVAMDTRISAICELVHGSKEQVAVIARTNGQLVQIAKELKSRGIDFSSTTYSASSEAKKNIIDFLIGMLSTEISEVKTAMFTPFFPIPVQKALEISAKKDITLSDIDTLCPDFAKLRVKVKNVEDISYLFQQVIVPISIAYGKEYLFAAMSLHDSLQEAFKVMDDLSIGNLSVFLISSDLLSEEPEASQQVILTTVHKAKGRQFDKVIYAPTKSRDTSNFADLTVEYILKSKGIQAKEELEEEDMRVNFVAFTRAKQELIIITDKPQEYVNTFAELSKLDAQSVINFDFTESRKKAYSLFLNGDFDQAKELLANHKSWIAEYVQNHFQSLKHISPTTLQDSAYDYLVRRLIKIDRATPAMQKGTDAHSIAESLVKGEDIQVEAEMEPFKQNILTILTDIKKQFPIFVGAEEQVEVPLKSIVETDDDIKFFGKIDAIFRNDDAYLIVDWKTDADDKKGSKYRQQIDAYRRAYAAKNNISLNTIRTAIAFIGLRSRIKTGRIECRYDEKQPIKSAIETFTKKVNLLLSWKKDVNKFFEDLLETEQDDVIWRSVIEEYKKEAQNEDKSM